MLLVVFIGFHCFFRADIRPKKVCAGGVDLAEQDSSEPHVNSFAQTLEPPIPASQAATKEIAFILPTDLAATIHLATGHIAVFQRGGGAAILPCGKASTARRGYAWPVLRAVVPD